ncbi:RNA splicing factor PRP9 [Mycena floridula]|nr:RNA splicing factor PRP9 [Mycena floridula]
MDSLIEVQRQAHEEIERFERGLYSLLSRNQPTQEIRLQTEHKSAQVLDRIAARTVALNNLYEDEAARNAEIELLSGPPNNPNDLSQFYARFDKIKEHYNKYPDPVPDGFELELATLLEEPDQDAEDEYEEDDVIGLLFSGEEGYGRYMDLYANHSAYNNLKGIGKRPGYLQYLDLLIAARSGLVHEELSRETRFSKDYETYIKNLHSYVLSFTKRAQPLEDHQSRQREAELDFEKRWDAGEISGWEDNTAAKANLEGAGIWCSACQKHYSKQTVYDAHLTAKKHIKAAAKQTPLTEAPINGNGHTNQTAAAPVQSALKSRIYDSARFTHMTTSLLASLVSVLTDTKSNVERRFALTLNEREAELVEQAKKPAPPPKTEEDGNEEEEEERIYNPLKLPMGWDGKPIPYWLYKLHGLGVEYRCEICSDAVYMGRKNFDRHFQESRHAFGMRALGLPNTKHFHEITRIDDALALAEKLKQEGRHEIFEQETMEELEDDDGNVYNRKTYEDLKKQGLI